MQGQVRKWRFRMHNRFYRIVLCLLFVFLMPAMSFANSLTITDVDTPEEGAPASEAQFSIYFELKSGGGMPITGVNAENCSVLIDGSKPEVVSANIREFKEGDRGVGVLFIFPIAKNYGEDTFGIRSALNTLVQLFNRDIDMLNAIPYDNVGAPVGWSKASDNTLSRQINEMQTSEVVEPNLFQTFQPAISVLNNLQNVSKKYVVLISDAEGAVVGDRNRAGQLIGSFTDQLKKSNITPIIVGYSPDGAEAMTNVDLLKRIASNCGGQYFQAENPSTFQHVIQSDVYDYIFKNYIYDVTLNMTGDNYRAPGKYNLQLIVKSSSGEDKNSTKITLRDLRKSRLWLWLLIGGLLLGGAGVAAFIIYRRNQEDDEEIIDEGPKEVCCATCGKVIPQQLFGFNGEFCLMPGGLPDCPYYQMPDKGKLQITRGPLADTTFFIKKDMTTIGSYPENDIYLSDKSVSRKHAAIKTDEGKRYEIRDFGSSNGLWINNEKTDRKFLRDGDLIRFGTVETVFKLK